MTSKKTTAFNFILGAFFQIKALQALILPKFFLRCSNKNKKTWPPK